VTRVVLVVVTLALAVAALTVAVAGGPDGAPRASAAGAERRAVVRLPPDATADADPPRRGDAVRIAGVPVGAVTAVATADRTTTVTLVVGGDAPPLDRATRARARRVATGDPGRRRWIELLPPARATSRLPDGGTLAAAGPVPGEATRAPTGGPGAASDGADAVAALRGGAGEDADVAIGGLGARAADAARVLRALERQSDDARTLLRATTRIARAAGGDGRRLARLLDGASAALGRDGARARAVGRTVRALPALGSEIERTVAALRRFADAHGPTIAALRPAVRDVAPTLRALRRIAPDLRDLARRVAPVEDAARRGLPGLGEALDGLRPLADELDAVLRDADPALEVLVRDAGPVGGTVARVGATVGPPGRGARALRVVPIVGPQSLAGWTARAPASRPDPYPSTVTRPDGDGIAVFEDRHCGRDPLVRDGDLALLASTLRGSSGAAGPACRLRDGRDGDYPHVRADPPAP